MPPTKDDRSSNRGWKFKRLCRIVESKYAITRPAQAQALRQGMQGKVRIGGSPMHDRVGQVRLGPSGKVAHPTLLPASRGSIQCPKLKYS